jgi:hypothetical protein
VRRYLSQCDVCREAWDDDMSGYWGEDSNPHRVRHIGAWDMCPTCEAAIQVVVPEPAKPTLTVSAQPGDPDGK